MPNQLLQVIDQTWPDLIGSGQVTGMSCRDERKTGVHLFGHIHRQHNHIQAFAPHPITTDHHVIWIAIGFRGIADDRQLVNPRQLLQVVDVSRLEVRSKGMWPSSPDLNPVVTELVGVLEGLLQR
ncbi:hypothetical protein D3C80_1446290 [compost metagenome]